MRKGTTKSHGKKHSVDKFYTHPDIALQCIDFLPNILSSYDVCIEPSAGSGSFSSLVSGCLALDLHPEKEGIIEQDWFDYSRVRSDKEKVLVLGNPPFGQQNSLAIKFINHAALFADTIAFILPLSFKKDSLKNKIDSHFHLTKELVLPKKSFLLNGEPYGVPCVFQVWEYNANVLREKTPKITPEKFTFTSKEGLPHFSIQRIGGRSGFADTNWKEKSVQSNYFIRLDDTLNATEIPKIIDAINNTVFESRNHSVGPRSISKNDIVKVVNSLLS